MKLILYIALVFCWVASDVNAMNGIFWQPQQRDLEIPSTHWQSLMYTIHQQGFDTLIIQWSRYGQAFSQPEEQAQLHEKILEARQAGLRLIIGLYSDPDFFQRQHQPPVALKRYLQKLQLADLWLVRYWQSNLFEEPDGWYISTEIDDYNWRDPVRSRLLLNWLQHTRKQISKFSSQPVYVSTFFAGNMSPTDFTNLLKKIQKQNVQVWVQDGSGVGTLSLAERKLYIDAAANCEQGPAAGVIYELFRLQPNEAKIEIDTNQDKIQSILQQHSCKQKLFFSLRYLPAGQEVLAH